MKRTVFNIASVRLGELQKIVFDLADCLGVPGEDVQTDPLGWKIVAPKTQNTYSFSTSFQAQIEENDDTGNATWFEGFLYGSGLIHFPKA